MKKIGFIGGADKTDIITYISKVLQDLNKRVLVIDATIMQKFRYTLPNINPTKSYITDFENTDYAIGFENLEEVANYLGVKEFEKEQNWNYDYILIDIDNASGVTKFGLEDSQDSYFVTSFDMYSLKKGIDILKNLPEVMNLSRILINYDTVQEDEEYLDFLTIDTKVVWKSFSVFLMVTTENQEIIEENQRVYKARLKRLVPEYQETIVYIVQNIVKDISTSRIRKMIKE